MLLFWLQIDASESWQIFWGTVEPLEQLFGPPPWMEGFVVHPKILPIQEIRICCLFQLPLGCQKILETTCFHDGTEPNDQTYSFLRFHRREKRCCGCDRFWWGEDNTWVRLKTTEPPDASVCYYNGTFFVCLGVPNFETHPHSGNINVSLFLLTCQWKKLSFWHQWGICQTRMRRHFNQKRRRLKKKLRFSFVH